MSNQDLRPIVISPLAVVVNGCGYNCSGDGLLRNGHAFQSDLTDYLPLLEPKRTKGGSIAARQPTPIKKTRDWWQAQCAFRGLAQSGNVSQLQDRLRWADSKSMNKDVLEAEVRLNREFREQNAAVRDSKWRALTTDEAKAEADPVRFLRERLAEGDGKTDAVILKTHQRFELHRAAESLGFQSCSTNAPLNLDGSRPTVDRWIVIGRGYLAVSRKIEEIGRQAKSSFAKKQQERELETQAKHEEVVKQSTAKRSAKWDVTGTWAIRCPYIEKTWGMGVGYDECTLTIHETIDGPAKQIWAEFDFIAVTGVFRFVRPSKQQDNQPAKGSRKRKREASEERRPNVSKSVPSAGRRVSYLLDRDDNPSPSHPTWEYRWRGEETGEGEVQLYSDEASYSITFTGPSGTKLHGVFGGDLMEDCTFTGQKIGGRSRTANSLTVEDQWGRRSEDAYEYARRARWH